MVNPINLITDKTDHCSYTLEKNKKTMTIATVTEDDEPGRNLKVS